MRIIAVDTSKTVLVSLKLEAKNFAKFKCKKKKLILGVNLVYFHKLIKSMDKDAYLTLSVENDDKNSLIIKIDNPEAKKDTTSKLKLLDPQNSNIKISDMRFDAAITMNSGEFHKLCREMNQIAEYVEIMCLTDKITFTCKGQAAETTTTYRTGDDGITIQFEEKKDKLILQGIYELRHLALFSKCSSLCNDIQIFMRNDHPLIIRYTVATLGRILLCLAPTANENTTNVDDEENEKYYSDEEIELL